MGIFRDLTQKERSLLSERKAQVDSMFLADDVIVIFESINQVFEVSEISKSDTFKSLILSNINFIWENDLTDDQKRYYYQNLGVFIRTPGEEKDYFTRLISHAADDVIKRITDYLAKHKEVEKVFFRYPKN